MTHEEVIEMIKSSRFANEYGFDLQTLVNAVGALGEMFRNGYTIAPPPRVMTLEEVKALPYGYVLLETDKAGSLRWVDALLFCKHTNFSFDFITLEGRAKLLGTDYNKEWRCWTSRPTGAQIEAAPRLRAEEGGERE